MALRDPLLRTSALREAIEIQLETARDRLEGATDPMAMGAAQGQARACRAMLAMLEELADEHRGV